MLLALGARIACYSLAFYEYPRPLRQAYNLTWSSETLPCWSSTPRNPQPMEFSRGEILGIVLHKVTFPSFGLYVSPLSFIPECIANVVSRKRTRLSLKGVLEGLWFRMTNNFAARITDTPVFLPLTSGFLNN